MVDEKKPAEASTSALTIVKTTISPVSEIAEKNLPVMIEKSARVKMYLSKVTAIKDDKVDQWSNDALVKFKPEYEEVKKLRMEITKKTDDLKTNLMKPEKEMEAEIERITKLRNEYAAEKARAAKIEQDKIDREKNYKIHEAEVKGRIKTSIETGVASKISDIENAIAKMFNEMTLETSKAIEEKITALKPKLKEEYYHSLFTVPFDHNIMSDAQYEDLIKRAKAYEKFSYEYINKAYVEFVLKVCAKWKSQVGPRVIELEKIKTAGADQAAKMQKAAADRAAKEEADRKAAEQKRLKEIEIKASEETQKTVLEAEFDAQVKAQSIEEQDGIRKRKVFRISQDGEADMLKIAKVISSAIINVLTDQGRTAIFKREKEGGNLKQDEDGHAVYVDGVQYWLDQLAKLKYTPQIEFLTMEEKVTKVAQKSK